MARVEYLFGVIKNQFGFRKARYKGLGKNAQTVFMKCVLANIVMAKPFTGNVVGEACLKNGLLLQER